MTSLISLLFVSPAWALDHELTVQTGYVTNDDPAFNLFSERNRMSGVGIRAVGALGDHLGLVGNWQHTGRGASVNGAYDYEVYDEESDAFYGTYTREYQSALRTDQFSLGPIADWEMFDGTLAPYVHADMLVQRGTAYLASGEENYPNRVEIQRSAWHAGVAAMAGVAVNIPVIAGFEATLHAEVGTTQYFGALNFNDLGAMQPGGFTLRTGLGVRY